MRILTLSWAMVLTLLFCNAVSATELFDTFDRADSNVVGYTEKVFGGRWVEIADNNENELISVGMGPELNVLRLHYFYGDGSVSSNLACNVGGFTAANIDLSVKCKPYSTTYGKRLGVAYRLPNQTARWPSDSLNGCRGYYVRIDANSQEINLNYGNDSDVANIIATATGLNIPINSYSTIRVVAFGINHKVYWQDNLIIDVNHAAGDTGAGYVGLWDYYSISSWDDFSVLDTDSKKQFSDDFNRYTSGEVGMMKVGGNWEWQEAGDTVYDDLIKIINNVLDFHYFRGIINSSSLAANVKNFQAADVDISVNANPETGIHYNSCYGLSYRLSSPANTYRASAGYYVRLDKTNGQAYLWYNTTNIAQTAVSIPDGYSRLRVVAQGANHKVYFYPNSKETFDSDADSNDLRDIDGYVWHENEGAPANIKIFNHKARFTYDSGSWMSANITDYIASDIDISADINLPSGVNKLYGFGYRLESLTAKPANSGFWVYLDTGNTQDKIWLKYGSSDIADANITIPAGTSTLRVVAFGSRHRVYLNGVLILDVLHPPYTAGGYCGIIARFYSSATTIDFDNITVIGRDADALKIDITNASNTAKGYVGIFDWYSITKFDNFKAEVLPPVYPVATDFPLMLYAMEAPINMDMERTFGWNMYKCYGAETYNGTTSSKNGSQRYFCHLPCDENAVTKICTGWSEPNIAAAIIADENDSYLGWWDLPEEQRWWKPTEMAIVVNYSDWIRTYDPDQRPVYMYIPSHYSANSVAHYVEYLDIVPASCYTYGKQPYAWVRWRMEETCKGITNPSDPNFYSYDLGLDYLNDEKTLFGILELYPPASGGVVRTPEGAYHDFWQCVVSRAQGLGVYSWSYRNDYPEFKRSWDMYCRGASEITGPEQLGDVILNGTLLTSLTVTYNSGATQTPEFVPTLYDANDPDNWFQYPSIDLLYKSRNNYYYLFTVSSATGSCNATISGLPQGATTAKVLFEGRTVPISNGSLRDTWQALGVHIYKIN